MEYVIGVGVILVLVAVVAWRRRAKGEEQEGEGDPIPRAGRLSADELEAVIDPTAEQDRLNPRPRAPVQEADDCWTPPGQAVTVRGYRIDRGMVYVGAGLYRDHVAWKPEDYLVDPTLPVAAEAPDAEGRTVSLWPSYHKLTPNARAAYLAWLAEGAEAPDVPPGFVMLYFYGLERRLRRDDPSPEEARAVRAEVERLRTLYAHHAVFGQASAGVAVAGSGGGRSGLVDGE